MLVSGRSQPARSVFTLDDAHGEEDSLPSGVDRTQIRHEIPSAFVA